MKWHLPLFAFPILIACNNPAKDKQTSTKKDTAKITPLPEKELVAFLDSIGNIDPKKEMEKPMYLTDSVLRSHKSFNKILTAADFKTLKQNCREKQMDADFARRILPELDLDSNILRNLQENKFWFDFHSFDKDTTAFNEFAITIGSNYYFYDHDLIYFFSGNKVVAIHKVYHRYGLGLTHFKNEQGKTTVYYNVNYSSGTGVWWYQYNFYQYQNKNLVPVLTEIKEVNSQYPWTYRPNTIKTTIMATSPLTMKFVYQNGFKDSLGGNETLFLHDSTELTYTYNKLKCVYIVDSNHKLNRQKLLTYNQEASDIYFIKTYYNELRSILIGSDKIKRIAVLSYLNIVRNDLKNLDYKNHTVLF